MIMLLLFVLANVVSAASINLKDNYEKGETIIVEIKGEITNIAKEDIEFRRGHVAVPFNYDLKRISTKYYIWAITPNNEINYTLSIKGVGEKNFSVIGNKSDYSIEPGFIQTDRDFEVSVQLNEENEKTISIDFPSAREIILKPGKNIIKFSVSNVLENSFIEINIGKYVFPAYILKAKNDSIKAENIKLNIIPSSIKSTVLDEKEINYPFQIINEGDSLNNIRIEYNKELFYISQSEEISLVSGAILELNINFTGKLTNEQIKKGIKESISIIAGDYSVYLPIEINFTKNAAEVDTPYLDNYEKPYYCSELKGIICTAGEKCTGESKTSIDGACCLASCTKESGGSSAWIGYLIAGAALAIIIFIYIRYKRVRKSGGFEQSVANAEKNLP